MRDPFVRFFTNFHVDEKGCWIWHTLGTHGYGHFSIRYRTFRAHRWIYEQLIGPIPDNKQPDHRCDTPACANPWHLKIVTARENVLRSSSPPSMNARKTHCKRGHSLANAKMKNGSRVCIKCRRLMDCQRYHRAA